MVLEMDVAVAAEADAGNTSLELSRQPLRSSVVGVP